MVRVPARSGASFDTGDAGEHGDGQRVYRCFDAEADGMVVAAAGPEFARGVVGQQAAAVDHQGAAA